MLLLVFWEGSKRAALLRQPRTQIPAKSPLTLCDAVFCGLREGGERSLDEVCVVRVLVGGDRALPELVREEARRHAEEEVEVGDDDGHYLCGADQDEIGRLHVTRFDDGVCEEHTRERASLI